MNPALNVLIIDDEPSQHRLMCDYLQEENGANYHFLHAYTGSDGEKMYHDNSIDCVLLDYRLPDTDGLEILDHLSHSPPVAPVVMLTGEGNESVAVEAMKRGSQDYLSKKALTPSALRRSVSHAAERVKILRQMESYRRDLERSNRDLALFANVAAHDLKAPLRSISQHLALIQERVELDEKTQRSFEFAIQGANNMRELLDGLFAYSKIGFSAREMEEVDLNLIMESVRCNMAAVIEETHTRLTCDPLPQVVADRVQVLQLLQNLVSNSIKFCQDAPYIHVGARKRDSAWECYIRDNGIGIAPADHQKIFTVFKRLHHEKEYPGTGIGLTICQRVVENHRGNIWVDSTPGQGSTFYFTLPAQAESERSHAAG